MDSTSSPKKHISTINTIFILSLKCLNPIEINRCHCLSILIDAVGGKGGDIFFVIQGTLMRAQKSCRGTHLNDFGGQIGNHSSSKKKATIILGS